MSIENNHKQFKEWWSKAKNTLKCDEYDAFEIWAASSNREGYKLVPVEPSDHMKCVVRDFDPDIEDYANMSSGDWESLCADIYKAMIGGVIDANY